MFPEIAARIRSLVEQISTGTEPISILRVPGEAKMAAAKGNAAKKKG